MSTLPLAINQDHPAELPEIAPNPTPGIMERAVCLSLEFCKPGNRRKVNSNSVEVDADKAMISVSKQLLDSPEYKAIGTHDGEVRNWITNRALPGPFRAGVYLVPNELVLDCDTYLRNARARRLQLIDLFIAQYPRLQEEAREKLGTLYDPTDYPAEEDVRRGFSLTWRYFSFNTPSRLSSISTALFERERDKAAETWKVATDEVRDALRVGFAELVSHMTERLSGDKVFRNSLVDNFREFLSTFEFRNITDDAQLQEHVQRARQLLDGVDPDSLRNEEALRDAVHRGMSEIDASLDGMIQNRPKRKMEV